MNLDFVYFAGELPHVTEADSPDATLDGADWLKSGMDFAFAKDVEGMRAYLASEGISVEHFKTLPIFKRDHDKYPWFRGL